MKIHEREFIVKQVENTLLASFSELERKHALTTGESLRVANYVFSEIVGGFARIMIRIERHGDADRHGGLE
jgi:hypothetical protein